MKKIANICLLFVMVAFSQTACLDEPLMLSKEDKKVIDSIFNAERKEMIADLDSLCDLHFDARVGQAVDSIMGKRLKEIERLKGPAKK